MRSASWAWHQAPSILTTRTYNYPIMNLAVGGAWGGPPNAATQFPASMDVDYIRIWQQTS